MSMQSLKEIGQKLLKLESGNKALTDGWTLKIFRWYNIIPRHILWARHMQSHVFHAEKNGIPSCHKY